MDTEPYKHWWIPIVTAAWIIGAVILGSWIVSLDGLPAEERVRRDVGP
jgi:hypothetical protein